MDQSSRELIPGSVGDGLSERLITARQLIEDAWQELRRRPFVQQQLGEYLERLPDLSEREAARRSAVGRSLLSRLNALEVEGLPHDLALTLRLVRSTAQAWSRELEWYWTVSDSLGVGFFGLFLPTGYGGGLLLSCVHEQLAEIPFASPEDLDRYLALASAYVGLIDQFTERTSGQARRGIFMPQAQLTQARTLLKDFKVRATIALAVHRQRLQQVESRRFERRLHSLLTTQVPEAFDRALEGLSEEYAARAPETVGMSQYPGGGDLYAELVKLHTTLPLSPQGVQTQGVERMRQLRDSLARVRGELESTGEPRLRAECPNDISLAFEKCLERLKPILERHFPPLPQAPYGVGPLPQALEKTMTYGYYDAPRKDHSQGTYFFNAANLGENLFMVPTLTAHELIPGHHLHFATQQENPELHPFRRYSFANAFNEGWAEYAAACAGEFGLYEHPAERYGRLKMEALLTSRLVVDTGMNALGWTLKRARAYLQEHAGMAEPEVRTESLRYSCDIPAQALAYKLGDRHILALREKMSRALGERFTLKEFHTVVLRQGALPLSDLAWHLEHEIQARRKDCLGG